MEKTQKRVHNRIANLVASVYFNTRYLDKCITLDNGAEIWNYDTIAICVSNSKRLNNDWYNGDKRGLKLDNRSTGNIRTIVSITSTIEAHVAEGLVVDGIVAIEFEPTDEHRAKAYKRMIHKFINKYNISDCFMQLKDNSYLYILIS